MKCQICGEQTANEKKCDNCGLCPIKIVAPTKAPKVEIKKKNK